MANVIYKFDYFEDRDLIRMHQCLGDIFGALHDIDNMVRNRMKHEELPDAEYQFLERLRDEAAVIHEMDGW